MKFFNYYVLKINTVSMFSVYVISGLVKIKRYTRVTFFQQAMAICYLPRHPNALLWLFRCTNIFKLSVNFRVTIRFRVKLEYIPLDPLRLELLLTRLASGFCMHLYVEG